MNTRCVLVVASVAALASCFAVEPLPSCGEIDGLVAAYHVCMPRSGVSIPLAYAPRQLLAGNFDGETVDGVDVVDDLALLIDESSIAIFTSSALASEAIAPSAVFVAAVSRVERMTSARFYGKAGRGEDIFVATGAVQSEPGTLIGWANQGAPALFDQDAYDAAVIGTAETCPTPSAVRGMYTPDKESAGGVLVACTNDGPGAAGVGVSGLLYENDGGALSLLPKPLVTKYAQMRAGAVAPIDGLGLDDIIFSFAAGADDHLGVVLVGATPDDISLDVKTGEALEVPLAAGEVSVIFAADLDEDGDVDVAAIHPQTGVISIVRQKRSEPLTFEAAEAVTIGSYIDDAILGDFSRDGRLDVAIAHAYADTGISVISFLIRQPDALPGSTAYGFVPATFGLGEITDLEPIDLDRDGWLDIAAAFKTGNTGSVEVYLNRSPAGA